MSAWVCSATACGDFQSLLRAAALVVVGGECARQRGADGCGLDSPVGSARDRTGLAAELVSDDRGEYGVVRVVELELVVNRLGRP